LGLVASTVHVFGVVGDAACSFVICASAVSTAAPLFATCPRLRGPDRFSGSFSMDTGDDAIQGGKAALLGTFWGYVLGSVGEDVVVGAGVVVVGSRSSPLVCLCRRVRWTFSCKDSSDEDMIPVRRILQYQHYHVQAILL
jgi:hypothetical protein